jgi:hypothetical protein
MTPEQAAHETRDAIVATTSRFMFDPALYARGAELGFDGFDFYVAGRAGVLGDVPADVVTAALVFFRRETVDAAWRQAGNVMARDAASRQFIAFGHAWAVEHFGGEVDWEQLASLLAPIVEHAPVPGAPLFAGWRLVEEPHDATALVLHRMFVLRELRGALHGAAVLTVGLTPAEAISVRSPELAGMFGWDEPVGDAAPLLERWKLAEARTDRMLGRHFGVLGEDDRKELVEMLGSVKA